MSVLLLYGSETGTAQDIAETLRREAEMRHLPARVHEFDEFTMENLQSEKVVIFVVSTTGQGEMPPNMRRSWKWLLKKSLSSDLLANVNTAVLGLGDSSYQKYNFAGKKLYRRLIQLGASMMTDIGLADDQHELGIDGVFIQWKQFIWKAIKELNVFNDMTLNIDTNVKMKPKFRFVDVMQNETFEDRDGDYSPLRVESNTRVTSEDHFQDTRVIRLQIKPEDEHSFRYQPGDVMMVRPYNPQETIDVAIEALGYSEELLNKPVRVTVNNPFVKPPPYYLLKSVTTVKLCLQRYFDLQQVPKRSFFEVLSYFSNDPNEKERLAELASPEGLDDLIDYANRCRRTTAEALRDFPLTAKSLVPDQLFELFSVIRPRAFSIASPPSLKTVELLVAKVEYTSRMSEKRRGLCSTFITRLVPGDEVFCKVRSGTFKFPDAHQPVVCVGPGTGVAPFRSLLLERCRKSDHSADILFFGCRSRKKDFYFEKEWKDTEGVDVVVAFSRDTDKKIYVQHKIGERAKEVNDLLNRGASVFIAGSAGEMPKAVANVLKQLKGEEWVAKAEASGKIQYETWS